MLRHISKIRNVMFVCVATLFIAGLLQAQEPIVLDFEDGSLDNWEVIDESPENLGDKGPSSWEIRDSQLGLDGKVLFQGSNIWGSAADSCLMGTFIIYKAEQFTNFTIEVDVAAADNDGMGLVWAFTGTDKHYRVIMINDQWPDIPVDGIKGPFLRIDKRIGDKEPWYEGIAVVKDNYTPYPEGPKLHWKLEVDNGVFKFTREDGLSVTGEDHTYQSGYVGIQLYAQQAEFDNFTITPHAPSAVRPADKMATFWGTIKEAR
jgi:hypothetical protein